jgi:hypothetical protein
LMPNPKAQQTQEVSNNPVLVTLASQRRGPTKNIKGEQDRQDRLFLDFKTGPGRILTVLPHDCLGVIVIFAG